MGSLSSGDRSTSSCRAYLWAIYLVLGLLLLPPYFILDGAVRDGWYNLFGLALVGAIACGVHLHRPTRRWPWYLFAVGKLMLVAGDFAYTTYEHLLHLSAPYPSLADPFYLTGYGVVIAGMILLVRSRRGGQDTTALVDVFIVISSVAVLTWVLLIEPRLRFESELVVPVLISIAYPMLDLLLLASLALLAFDSGSRQIAVYLLGLSIAADLLANSIYGHLALQGDYFSGHLVDAGWLLAYLLMGTAALHPTMRLLAEPAPRARHAHTLRRLLLLGAVALCGPIGLTIQVLRGVEVNLFIMAGSWALMVLLALLRTITLLRDLSRTGEELRRSEAGLRTAQRIAGLGSWEWNVVTDEVEWSDELYRILGLEPRIVTPSYDIFLETVHPDDRAYVETQVREALAGKPYRSEHRVARPDGSVRVHRELGEVVFDEAGRPLRMFGTTHDITEQRALEAELQRQAFHDSLTGLPNRALFVNRLEQALARTARRRTTLAVLFLDLDRFKVINDSLGHEVGDRLLVAVGARLQQCVRGGDTVARLGGDEFTILLEEIEALEEAVQAAERIAAAMKEPFLAGGHELFVTASIGLTTSSGGAVQASDLLRQADIAMYRTKSKGRAHYEVFDSSMDAYTIQHLELENDLRRAVERAEFTVHYQPTMELNSGRVKGMEALVRWEHPQRGLVPPGEFIPLAEETGLILPIGWWVLREACRQARGWQVEHPDRAPGAVMVNLSARQFQYPGLADEVARVLAETRLDPACLVLEITESVVMEAAESNIDTLRALKRLGVQLAIDDFGTGYSSLSYLKRFPVDTLKIDRTFVSGLGEDPEDTAIAQAVITLAAALNLHVTAEGVETADQVAHLLAMGCQYAQGYHFSRPLTAAAAGEFLRGGG